MDATSTMQQAPERNRVSCCAGAWSFCQCPGAMAARYIYAVIFLVGNVYTWLLRENPKWFFQRQRLSGCHGSRVCLESESVLIISMTLFLFYMFMFFTTVGTKSIHDPRHSWHSHWWPAKILLLVGCFVISSMVTSNVLQLYGKVAQFGAGAFLFIQLISVMRYITRLNSKWCGQENFQNHKLKVNTVSQLAYVCSIVGIVLMIFWYVGCYVNAAIIFTTLLLVYIMPIISILNKVNKGFYMEPALLGVYIVFLCWSSIKSEPETKCYKKEKTGSGANWITIISFIVEMASVTVATFSTGTDYKIMQFLNVAVSGNDVPYGYGFFHFVFAMGSMFFGMLFLGWDPRHPSDKWSMDVSWTSTLVHLINGGLVVISFAAVIIARRFGIGWLQQLLGDIFGIGGQQQQHESNESRTIELTRRSDTENPVPPPPESGSTDQPRGGSGETTENVVPPPADDSRAEPPRRSSAETDDAVPPLESRGTQMDEASDGNRPPPESESSESPALLVPQEPKMEDGQASSSSSLHAPDQSRSSVVESESEITVWKEHDRAS